MRPKYQFGEFELNPASRELLRNGMPIALRPRSLECLVYLIEHRERAVGRDELIAAVWGRIDASDTVVAQTLLRARKALDDTGNQQAMIRTLPRFGYQWVAPVREIAIAAGTGPEAPADAAEQVVEEAPADRSYVGTVDGRLLPATTAADVPAPSNTTSPIAPTPGRHRWDVRLAMLAALAVIAALALVLWLRRPAEPQAAVDGAVLVMPVSVVPPDPDNAWVRLGAMDYMAARLRSSGINVLPSELALRLGKAVEGDAPGVARDKLRSLSGAQWIAVPEVQREGNQWQVRLRLFDKGREQQVQGRGDTALAAVADASDLWLRQLGGQGEAPPPTPATERLQQLDAQIQTGQLQDARRLLRTASAEDRADPRFVLREAKLEFRASHVDEAADLFQKALDHASEADLATRIGALQGLASAERARNHLAGAELRYGQSLALLQAMPHDHVNARSMGLAYQGLGIVRAERGDIDGGIRSMGQARVWIQRSGDLVLLGVIGHNIGKADELRGDYLQALGEFDRSIEIFARLRVNDYLANTLGEKARLLLALARTQEAAATIARARPLLSTLEDDHIAVQVLTTVARIQLAQGRLHDAGATLDQVASHATRHADPSFLELLVRLYLARGEAARAKALITHGGIASGANDGLMLAAVQAALRAGDVPLAKAWLSGGTAVGEQDVRYHVVALELARALIARAEGDGTAAIDHAHRASAVVGITPEAEIQAGVAQATGLLAAQQYDGASAILGGLEKYADTDYRVAWAMLALYRALGDHRASSAARARVDALRGERGVGLVPAL